MTKLCLLTCMYSTWCRATVTSIYLVDNRDYGNFSYEASKGRGGQSMCHRLRGECDSFMKRRALRDRAQLSRVLSLHQMPKSSLCNRKLCDESNQNGP